MPKIMFPNWLLKCKQCTHNKSKKKNKWKFKTLNQDIFKLYIYKFLKIC